MNKPIKKYPLPEMYDYHECEKYINEKYNIVIDDYAGRLKNTGNKKHFINDTPYQNFGHFLAERYEYRNGDYFEMDIEDLKDEANDWQLEIIELFKKEFADENGCISFYIWW